MDDFSSETGGGATEPEMEMLSVIVQALNESFGIGLTEDDRVDMETLQRRIYEDPGLRESMQADNTPQNKKAKFDKIVDDALLSFVHTKLDLYQKLTKDDVNRTMKQIWFDAYRKETAGQEAR